MKSASITRPVILGALSMAMIMGKAIAAELPSDDYFEVSTIIPSLNDPMQIAIDDKERVFIAERTGAVKLYDPSVGAPVTIYELPVHHKYRKIEPKYKYRGGSDCGILGIALDPKFENNHYIYFYYSPIEKDCNRLSRFTFNKNQLVDEVNVLEVVTGGQPSQVWATEHFAEPLGLDSLYTTSNDGE